MSLPTAYLTSTKKLPEILDAIKTAKAPEKFTNRFLEQMEFKGKGDRLIINLLKALNFIDDAGKPTDRYFEFLDQSQSAIILAEAIQDAYKDLFAVNTKAHTLSKPDVIGKFKTLTQGQYSDYVINFMAMTFCALIELADFSTPRAKKSDPSLKAGERIPEPNPSPESNEFKKEVRFGGLVYNIQLILPETRDTKVYDALFISLKEHIL